MMGKRMREEGNGSNSRIDFHHAANQMPSKRMKYSSNGVGYQQSYD